MPTSTSSVPRSTPGRPSSALVPALVPGLVSSLALLLVLPGCGRFDRGPAGAWDELARRAPSPPPASPEAQAPDREDPAGHTFDPGMVAHLPAPARRFLLHAVAPGTLLASSVELAMEGTILLEPGGKPLALEAEQILAPPRGFIWSARAHRGLLRIRGYDRLSGGEGEMRWRLFGLLPVMRAAGPDIRRSAAARLAMEGLLLPSFLLSDAVHWEAVDDAHATFQVEIEGERVVTTLQVNPDGRPLRAWAQRWNEGGYERFEVRFEGTFEAGGYRIPRGLEAGWRLGEADAFPFFQATLTSVTFR